ncbi:type I restriction enzyme M protein [Brevibacterium iodinum ATCC 49514]|uniref:Type I restriction enzyme M protein n=1 Tax=Brevibacterium iodinum ATCC 49514 TaxID=1255616 RepID=A0A2H1JU44_9MICO|nr:N-6 DNA methylase [Brevibacterium iodinum]SMX90798.1 type I restriction enzyme M protein [Brevibacterium iodinum ATCC 49514]SUW12419.1 Probable type I restriction enzyme BthVORF4518P M protein [Brevibacterium iodinum]
MGVLTNEGDVTGYELPQLVKDLDDRGFDPDAVAYKHSISVQQGRKKRVIEADAVMFEEKSRQTALVVIETKPPEPFKKDDAAQAISYARLLDNVAPFAILTNGLDTRAYDTLSKKQVPLKSVTKAAAKAKLNQLMGSGDLVAEARHELFRVENVQDYKRILRACHNAIRNNEGFDPTKAFDELSKVMFTKLYEEKHHGERFNLKKYDSMAADGVNIIHSIFEQTKSDPDFKGLFDPDATIELNARTVRQLVAQFENYDLSLTEFDVKGEAFEHFLGDTFTGGLGQYFTPRNVVDFMIEASDPKIGETVVDPFCGTGGFLIAWHSVVSSMIDGLPVANAEKETRRKTLDESSIFGIDWNERTAQACRMNLSMHGDGESSQNVFKQSGFSDAVTRKSDGSEETRIGGAMFDKCLTNPPFGATESDPEILASHDLGRGRNSIERAALAMERAISLTNPGGLVAIVIMDGILANPSMKFVRDWMRKHAKVNAMVSLNPETFEGYGGRANTSILLLEKRDSPLDSVPEDEGPVFMAMCHNSGYAPNGREVDGNDLIEILDAYKKWRDGETFESELAWAEPLRERLDPRHYWRPASIAATTADLSVALRTASSNLRVLVSEVDRIQSDYEESKIHDPSQFVATKIEDLLEEITWKENKIRLKDDETYAEVGVRWWGGGTYVRSRRRGSEIKANYMMPVEGGTLIYNRMFAFRASFAIAGDEVSGGYVSNEFPMFRAKDSEFQDDLLLRWIVHVLTAPTSVGLIDAESQGSTKTSRNRLNQSSLMELKIPIPNTPEIMEEAVRLLDRADALRDELKDLGDGAQSLRDSFSGFIPQPSR